MWYHIGTMPGYSESLQRAILSIVTQGDTGTPSIIKVLFRENNRALDRRAAVRVRVCNSGTWADSANATIAASSGYGSVVEIHQATKDLTFASQKGVAATETLTIAGVVIDGETVTIGTRVYEFDDDGSITAGRVSVDISGGSTQSQGELTVDTQPTIGDTLTIGVRTYSFVAEAAAGVAGEIGIGADLAGAQANIVAAINGADGWNTPNSLASAADFGGNASIITNLVGGVIGDATVTTETFVTGTNVFDAATLGTETAGVDCIAATAVTALALAITNDASALVSGVDGAGDTVDITALITGTTPNAYPTTETMANGSFSAAVMSGGVAEVLSEVRIAVTNGTAESITIRVGPAEVGGLNADYSADALTLTHAAP